MLLGPSESRIARRLRFRDLQVFFTVAECGSMAKAAVRLEMTQPSVSEIIASLESAFRVRLFDRGSHGVEPTIYGRALLKRGVAALDELKQGMHDIAFLADPAVGDVRIGCPDSICAAIVSPFVREFCRDYPRITLRVDDQVPTPTPELPGLRTRRLDVVLMRLSVPHQFGDDMNVEILFDDQAVVAAGAKSAWGRRRKIELSDLIDAPWVATPKETLPTMLIEQAFREANLSPPKIKVTTFSVHLRAHLLVTADFLSAMPGSMLRLSASSGGLKALPVKLPVHTFPVVIVTLKNRTLSPVVELFLERLRKFVKSSASDENPLRPLTWRSSQLSFSGHRSQLTDHGSPITDHGSRA